jgi:membrane-bound lytic murein transglycosylase B
VHLPKEAVPRIAAHVAHRAGTCRATRDMTVALPIKEWKALGVRLPNGGPLSAAEPDASLVSGVTRHFLVSRNYDALLEYNCSHSYAISAGLLADQIGSSAAPVGAQPRKPPSRRHPGRKHQG